MNYMITIQEKELHDREYLARLEGEVDAYKKLSNFVFKTNCICLVILLVAVVLQAICKVGEQKTAHAQAASEQQVLKNSLGEGDK